MKISICEGEIASKAYGALELEELNKQVINKVNTKIRGTVHSLIYYELATS